MYESRVTIACYPDSPIVESWTTYASSDSRALQVRDLKAFDLTLRSGTIQWLTGLQTPAEDGGSFTLTSNDLQAPLDLGSTRRATEQSVPWFMLDDGGSEQLFGGLLWPGAWSAHFERQSNRRTPRFGLTSFSTTVGATPLDTPHGYVGVADTATRSVAEATRVFIDSAVRHGRRYSPLVTYNTWFVLRHGHQRRVDDPRDGCRGGSGRRALRRRCRAGTRAGADPGDFTTGIGVVGGRRRSVSIRSLGVERSRARRSG